MDRVLQRASSTSSRDGESPAPKWKVGLSTDNIFTFSVPDHLSEKLGLGESFHCTWDPLHKGGISSTPTFERTPVSSGWSKFKVFVNKFTIPSIGVKTMRIFCKLARI